MMAALRRVSVTHPCGKSVSDSTTASKYRRHDEKAPLGAFFVSAFVWLGRKAY